MREINTKAVGVTHQNRDGGDRQKLIAKLTVGEALYLTPDSENEHDGDAIEVHRAKKGWFGSVSFAQIGFLKRDLAEDVAAHFKDGGEAFAVVTDLTGGTRDKPTRGVNIRLVLSDEGERL